MTADLPLVTIMITTKDRPAELERTLRELRRQDYPAVELLVIDDGSRESLESLVRGQWPEAAFVRHATAAGQAARRSEGFELARGRYILQLDDDSAPVDPDALRRAVTHMESRAQAGALAFRIFNGSQMPKVLPPQQTRLVCSFVGCGVLLRAEAVRTVGGYVPFFGNEWEEEEFGLRLLRAGWAIDFFPEVLIHHRVSPQNRRAARTWMRGFRNKLWAMVMHYPGRRLLVEPAWVLALAAWDAIRLLRPHYFLLGIVQFFAGLPRALRLRQPMSDLTMRRYDALRFRQVKTLEEFVNPSPLTAVEFWRWFLMHWRKRPRPRSFWDRRPGDVGKSEIVSFAHEFMDSNRRS
jgi:GT2 family glycosyltransferase